MKRFLAMLMVLSIVAFSGAKAEEIPGWLLSPNIDQTQQIVTEDTLYDAASSVGTVVNGTVADATEADLFAYSFSPIDVVLVLDCSGSMGNGSGQVSLLSAAEEAAQLFCKTLFKLNPASRVGVVAYSSRADKIADLTGLSDEEALTSAIGGIQLGGNTNTGTGYQVARNLLESSRRENVPFVTVMLSDGLANEGAADPVAFAINEGDLCAQEGLVYTIGLVGGLGSEEKRYTRSVLDQSYAAHYYEVDSLNHNDIVQQLRSAFAAIATCSGASEEAVSYQGFFSRSVQAAIISADGSMMSMTEDRILSNESTYGIVLNQDLETDSWQTVMADRNFTVRVAGIEYSNEPAYNIQKLHGSSGNTITLSSYTEMFSPALRLEIKVTDGQAEVVDLSYNPLDPNAVDPFTGLNVGGVEIAPIGYTTGSVKVFSAPSTKAQCVIDSLSARTAAYMLAYDSSREWLLIDTATKKGQHFRGWIKANQLEITSWVPIFYQTGVPCTIAQKCTSYTAPEADARPSSELKAGAEVTLLTAERDSLDREWAYISTGTEKKPCYAYVPIEALSDVSSVVPSGFSPNKRALITNVDEVINDSRWQLTGFTPASYSVAKTIPVYSGPDTSFIRANKNKASVYVGDTNAFPVNSYGRQGDYYLVQYELTKNDHLRRGYINVDELGSMFTMSQDKLPNAGMLVRVTEGVNMTDTPERGNETLLTLSQGTTAVYRFYDATTGYACIETAKGNQMAQGYVKPEVLAFIP